MDSTAVKNAVMQQVASEANIANARVLIEVNCDHPPRNETYHDSFAWTNNTDIYLSYRNSRRIASRSACPSPEAPCPAASSPAPHPAWRSTWPPGTRSTAPTSTACARSRETYKSDLVTEVERVEIGSEAMALQKTTCNNKCNNHGRG